MVGTKLFLVVEHSHFEDEHRIVGVFLDEKEAEEYTALIRPRVSGWDYPPGFDVEEVEIGWKNPVESWQLRVG